MSAQPRPPLRRYVTRVVIATLVVGTTVGAAAATVPAAAAPSNPTQAHVGQTCASDPGPGQARCFALARTDSAAPTGMQPHALPAGYGPADLQSAYQLPSATAGAGATVAVVDAFDNPDVEADLAVYREEYGLPACTTANGCFRKVNQAGDSGPFPAPGWTTEIALDVEMVSAACPNCHLLLVEADDNSLANLAAAVDTAVGLGAKYVSNSYGAPEDEAQLALAGHYDRPGIVITAATGDAGYGPAVFPASAPGVTAVGGTKLVRDNNARGWGEFAEMDGGSGCSTLFARPPFQNDPDCTQRTEADVSATAGWVAVYDGGWDIAFGTGVSSPIIAATYALAGPPARGSNPAAYPYEATNGLNDVTSGRNGGDRPDNACGGNSMCKARVGYDAPTGLGTPNGTAAFEAGPRGTVRGVVSDAATHAPVAGATVQIGNDRVTTGPDGAYLIDAQPGTHDARAVADGYSQKTISIVVTTNHTITRDFALTMEPLRSVSGTITDGSGHGWPLYATVAVDGVTGGTVYTDPYTGHYSLAVPAGHTYTATITPLYPGYQTRSITFSVGTHDHVRNASVPVDASSCSVPGYARRYSGLLEHFDTGTQPAGWRTTNGWLFDNPQHFRNVTGGTGGFAINWYVDQDGPVSTDLITPRVDLSDDPAPVVGLNSYYEAFPAQHVRIFYAVGGSPTWHQVWEDTSRTEDQRGHLEFSMPLAAHQSDVRVRFHYDAQALTRIWEIDDVYVGHRACDPVPGGLVEGLVTDATTTAPVVDAVVQRSDDTGGTATTTTTPDDANLPDGFYELFAAGVGARSFTAARVHYAATDAQISVVPGDVVRADFSLPSGRLEVDPATIERSVALGGSATARLTVRNTGTRAVQVDLGELPSSAMADSVAGNDPSARRVRGDFSPLRVPVSAAVTFGATAPFGGPWQHVTNLSRPTADLSVTTQFGAVYAAGGADSNGPRAALEKYDPGTQRWTQLADMSVARDAPASAWVGGKLYVTGGWGTDGNPVATTEAYDPATNNWRTVSANPMPFAASGVAVLSGKIYVIGGCWEACGYFEVEVYDPATDHWTSGPDYPSDSDLQPVSWLACGAIDATIYCAGGVHSDEYGANISTNRTYASDGTTWTRVADMPVDQWGGASTVANGKLLVSGGVINGATEVTNEGWSYDPSSDSWTRLPNANSVLYRVGGACGFYRLGGFQLTPQGVNVSSDAVDVLPGYDECAFGGQNISWLSENPTALTLAPGATAHVTVHLSAAHLSEPGTYTAALRLGNDTPYPVDPITVTFHAT